jgi:hypothetical protein
MAESEAASAAMLIAASARSIEAAEHAWRVA